MSVKWIAGFVAILLVVTIGVGALAYGKGNEAGRASAADARTRFINDRSGAAPGGGGGAAAGAFAQGGNGAGGGNNANMTAGTIKSVSGGVVEVSTATEAIKIKLTDQTQIQKTVQGTASDLVVGERVVIQGDKGSDGTLTARSIQLGRAGGQGGPGQAGAPGGATQPGSAPAGRAPSGAQSGPAPAPTAR
jgi:hypothetical protein